MPKRLSADAHRLVILSAVEEARRRGDRRLGTDHLLLGLLHDEGSPAARALGVSLLDARAASDALDVAALASVGVEAERLGEAAPASFRRGLPPLTSGAREVIKGAVDAAHQSRSGRIRTTHFLLAVLSRRLPDPAAELLEVLGVDRSAARGRLIGAAEGEMG
jgi:ATP-dependent Clp protease ATP-binding subunit ClpA